ncbi:MAG: glycosyltransferase [Desulfuromonadaceae bacterium]|nr:glycosyltransferase [Desulfuromonadaceae bacterium]MDD2854113.1 glycosyltransferase [Desulfuromonadaceae bacterium]
MSHPRVSVLMPVYNAECYLRESIESILLQTFHDFEFLIINDCSTDSSVSIIQSYSDSRICIIHNDNNIGVAASLNKGLSLAQGEYLVRMDADDISRAERLACQVDFMDSNPQIGVCGSWLEYFPRKSVWKLPKESEMIRCWQFHSVGVAHPTVILRRRLFEKYGLQYDPDYRYSQDYELWGRAIRYMEFSNIQKVLLDYRVSSEQICAIRRDEQLKAVAPLRLERVRELRIEPTSEQHELHEMIMNGVLPPESRQLDHAEKWLMQLESANRDVGIYSRTYFSRRLLDIWFSVCIALADDSVCTLRRCLISPLWSTVNIPVWHRLRALVAWILRKTK